MSSSRKNLVLWGITGLLALVFLAGGGSKVTSQLQAVEGFHHYGFDDSFRFFVGGAEVLGAIGLLLPPAATLSASGLLVVMFGAIFTHLSHGEATKALGPVLLFGLLLWVAYSRRDAVGLLLGAEHHAPTREGHAG